MGGTAPVLDGANVGAAAGATPAAGGVGTEVPVGANTLPVTTLVTPPQPQELTGEPQPEQPQPDGAIVA
jgi:hypothetical protein